MKNGGKILLLICVMSLCLVVGIFIGRNLTVGYSPMVDTEVTVPVTVEAEKEDMAALEYKLDINTASKVQLMELPGIGETIAQRIVDYREENGPFLTTDQLLEVEGIGEKKLLQIEMLIKVGEK